MLPALLDIGDVTCKRIVHHSTNGQIAIRDGEWKLALCPGSCAWGGPGGVEGRRAATARGLQLHDLAEDPGATRGSDPIMV
jgi:arylsulfatase A